MRFINGLIIFILLILPNLILAEEITIENPIPKYTTFTDLINGILNFLLEISLVLAPLFLIIAGYYFVTASGDPKQIETAKRIILYTLIGLLIVLVAKGIVALLKEIIGVEK